jgi:hypothetical protein
MVRLRGMGNGGSDSPRFSRGLRAWAGVRGGTAEGWARGGECRRQATPRSRRAIRQGDRPRTPVVPWIARAWPSGMPDRRKVTSSGTCQKMSERQGSSAVGSDLRPGSSHSSTPHRGRRRTCSFARVLPHRTPVPDRPCIPGHRRPVPALRRSAPPAPASGTFRSTGGWRRSESFPDDRRWGSQEQARGSSLACHDRARAEHCQSALRRARGTRRSPVPAFARAAAATDIGPWFVAAIAQRLQESRRSTPSSRGRRFKS